MQDFTALHGSLDHDRQEIPLATADQVSQLDRLIGILKLPEGTTEKWLAKAKVESFDEMIGTDIDKCIAYLTNLIKPNGGNK